MDKKFLPSERPTQSKRERHGGAVSRERKALKSSALQAQRQEGREDVHSGHKLRAWEGLRALLGREVASRVHPAHDTGGADHTARPPSTPGQQTQGHP